MSLLFLLLFIADIRSGTNVMTEGAVYAWALFSIADALWINVLWRK